MSEVILCQAMMCSAWVSEMSSPDQLVLPVGMLVVQVSAVFLVGMLVVQM